MLHVQLSIPRVGRVLLAALAATIVAGCATAPIAKDAGPGSVPRGQSGRPVEVAGPLAATTPGPSPAGGGAKPTAPPEAGGGGAGEYPYPVDAGSQVVAASLEVSPGTVASAQSFDLLVTIPDGRWISGQQVFIFLGSRYAATLPGPGTSEVIPVASPVAGALRVSAFQFPDNSPAAPIDAYATATVQVAG